MIRDAKLLIKHFVRFYTFGLDVDIQGKLG